MFALLTRYSGFDAPQTATTRVITILTMIGVGLLLTFNPRCRRRPVGCLVLAWSTLFAHQAIALVHHQMMMEMVVTTLLASAVIALILDSRERLVWHLSAWFAGMSIAAMLAEDPQFNPVYFALALGTENLFLYLVVTSSMAAREAEQHIARVMSGVFDQSMDALVYCYFNSDEVLGANAAARTLCQTDDLTVVGRIVMRAILTANPSLSLGRMREETPLAGAWEGNVEIVGAGGRRFWSDLSVRRVQIDNDDLVLIRFADVTDRLASDDLLRRKDMLLDNAQSMARVAGWELDVASSEMHWTQNMYELLGLTPADEAPRNLPDLFVRREESEAIRTAMLRCIQHGEGFDLPAELLINGEIRWMRYRAEPVFEGGKLTRAMGVLLDVTERVEREAELTRAREAAESAANARSRFLANMSHEIRTPMNGVIGMTSLLLDSDPTEEQRGHLETIRTSGESLLTIINEILDFSKIDAGHITLEHQQFDLETCIAEVLEIVSPTAAKKNLVLSLSVLHPNPRRSSQYLGDVSRLRQILLNLVSNAVKFTSSGEVSVVARATALLQDLVEISVTIKDTGIGIPPHKLNSLFDPFTQADASTTRRFGGTGLGLSISKSLAELMSGSIDVYSAEGQGSEFRVTVIMSSIADNDQLPDLDGIRIGLIDPNQMSRRRLVDSLRQSGASVVTDPIELAEAPQPELFVIDADTPPGLPIPSTSPCIHLVGTASSGRRFLHPLRRPARPTELRRKITTLLNPEHDRTARPQSDNQVEEASYAGLNILVAEDNLVNQKVAVQMLKKLGVRADVAANGLEAVHMLSQRHYSLILMDVQMPELDGLEATRCIRVTDNIVQPYIIAMTANAMNDDREACLTAGMNDFIAKPVRLDDLRQALDKAELGGD